VVRGIPLWGEGVWNNLFVAAPPVGMEGGRDLLGGEPCSRKDSVAGVIPVGSCRFTQGMFLSAKNPGIRLRGVGSFHARWLGPGHHAGMKGGRR
jgi:hypothetical protein